MGALAARKADFFAITMDDPGDEDTAAIAEQIAAGARSAGAREGQTFAVELDRRAAIRLLFERARPATRCCWRAKATSSAWSSATSAGRGTTRG